MADVALAARLFVRMVVPAVLVALSVALLGAAALSSAFGLLPDARQLALFGAGGLAWLVGIGWGVVVNERPLYWNKSQ